LEKRERLLSELTRVEELRDRERLIEDYDLEPILSSLIPQKSKDVLSSSDSSSDSSEMSEEEKDFYDELHAE
jgi:hypothetical protein